MKIIEMERRTMDGEPVVYDDLNECAGEYRDWWCVIETKEEEMVYDYSFGGSVADSLGLTPELFKGLWNKMVIHAGQGMGVSWGDDDMYGYIRPDEMPPEIGDEYIDGDNDKWARVA